MTFDQYAAIAIFAGAYVLIATERVHRVAAAMGGAGLMLALRLTDGETAYRSEEAGIDWNVIFLLLGMMMIVGVIKQTGLFEYLAIAAAQRARGRPYVLMVLLVVITAIASALLDNVTTVLLIAPVTFLVCDRLDLPVVPFLIAEIMASNIGGTATLIGDPPNIIIASRADLTFNDFVVNLAPVVVILLLVFLIVIRVMFRKSFTVSPDHVDSVMAHECPHRDQGPRPLGQEPRRPGSGAGRVHAPDDTRARAVSRRTARRRSAAADLARDDVRVPRRGRVGDTGVLRRAVRHGRGIGGHRGD